MTLHCPQCDLISDHDPKRPRIRRNGFFYRKSDSKWVRRFRCLSCGKGFSNATGRPAFGQKKRHLNHRIALDLCSSVTQRRIAFKLGINRKTVARKLRYLAARARLRNDLELENGPREAVVEFDDLETHEHSKCKPLSVSLAVVYRKRRILGFAVSRMPCRGRLAIKARTLYGIRKDQRPAGRRAVLERIAPYVAPNLLIKSDSNPHYPPDFKRHLPRASHVPFLGKRGAVTGQGELKKIGFDPLFSLNHTCASLRANISRLVRKTWSTTKKAERLSDHLDIYVAFHNRHLARAETHRGGPVSGGPVLGFVTPARACPS